MNKKFFVPFETAQLLKTKGYNESNDYVYDRGVEEGKECIDIQKVDFEYQFNDTNSDIDADIEFTSNICTAPTYHEVLDWLQGKGYPIESACVRWYSDSDWMWICCVAYINATKPHFTHEEALNAAILKALEML